MKYVLSSLKIIDKISEWSGKIVSYLVVAITLVMLYEIVARYFFGRPTVWVFEISLFLYGIYAVLIGAYVLQRGEHVNVDIFYSRFSPRMRAVIDLFTWSIFFLWVGAMLVTGWQRGLISLSVMEREPTTFGCPVYPLKLSIPVGAFLILLQGLAGYIRSAVMAITGKDESEFLSIPGVSATTAITGKEETV